MALIRKNIKTIVKNYRDNLESIQSKKKWGNSSNLALIIKNAQGREKILEILITEATEVNYNPGGPEEITKLRRDINQQTLSFVEEAKKLTKELTKVKKGISKR
jgi:hypothetical protein